MSSRRPVLRRMLQFSLRTFLVLLTAGCIWLGLKTEKVRRQRYLVRMVNNLGGELAYDYQYQWGPVQLGTPPTPPGPKLLRSVLGDDYFADLVSVQVKNVAEQDIARIAKQKSLRHLSVSSGVGDESLESISRLRHLERLELYGGRFTGAGFDRLSALPKLRALVIGNMGLSEESARSIGRLVHLEQLSLEHTRLASKHLKCLTGLRNLTSLDLSGTLVGDEGLTALYELKQLKTVRLDGTMVTARGIKKLQAALPDAEVSSVVVGHGIF
ncbi:MAG TPA: hypothetical protein VJ783_24465 [Pirellulales bacterium]|nr:hypothetical protein [Pirellulales bacterium]